MNWKLAAGSGMLLGIGFVAPELWPLVFIGFVPLIEGIRRARSLKRAFVFGWLTGCTLYGLGLFGVWWHTLPLEWLGFLTSWFQIIFVVVGWTLTSAGLALFVGVFAASFKYLSDGTWREIVYAAALWPLSEWLGAWWLSLQNYGVGARVGPHFALLFLGNLVAHDDALLQLATIGGVYALSAIVAAAGTLLYRIALMRNERSALLIVLSCALTLWTIAPVLLMRTSVEGGKEVLVAAVHTKRQPLFFPTPADDERELATMRALLPKTAGASIVVLPESSDVLRVLRQRGSVHAAIEEIYASTSLPTLIETESLLERGKPRERMEYYDVASGASQFTYKQFLLPGGEYLPFVYQALGNAIGQHEALAALTKRRGFVAATSSMPIVVRSTPIGALFCAETLSPDLYRGLAADGAQLFINSSSQSWFHGSRIVAAQMENVAKVRAVESRRWYIQASDLSPAFALDPYGRVVAEVSGSADAILVRAYAREDKTPYVRFGGWIPAVLTLFLFIIVARKWNRP